MKKLIVASLSTAVLAVAFTVPAAPPRGASYFALGVVQKTDRTAGTATVAHEPVATLNWPAMTMQFAVAEPALFERLPAGRQVAIEFVGEAGAYRIVNAIPLSQSSGAPAAGGGQHGMHGGMMGDMSGMREMCMGMMGQMGGGGMMGGSRPSERWRTPADGR